MESVALSGMFIVSRKRRINDAVDRRKRLRARRRREFLRRQTRERAIFAFMLCMAALTIQSPVRSVWVKPKSNSWWEQVVNSTFTPSDWLENFLIIHSYMCAVSYVHQCKKVTP